MPRYSKLEQALMEELGKVEGLLAEALGYPYEPDYGWVTGEHTPVTLALEVRSRGVAGRPGQ